MFKYNHVNMGLSNTSKYSHGGNIKKVKGNYNIGSKPILDFSVNLNPLGLSDNLRKYISNNIDSVLYYPDVSYQKLKEKIANYTGVKCENILVGNGSIEFIHLIPRALSIKKALIPVPIFSEYEEAVKLAGAKPIFIQTKEKENFKIDIDKIIKKMSLVDIIFLCNPNNPTGYLIPKEEIMFLIKKAGEKGIYIFIDEVFIEFVDDEDNLSMIREIKNKKNLLVLRSFTKFFSIPGLRIGYIAGDKNLIKKIDMFQPPWSVNSIAIEVARNILKDREFMVKSKVYIKKERERFFNKLKRIKFIKTFTPSANFMFCKLKNKVTSSKLFNKLAKKGIIIRDCSNFRGLNNKFVRFAVRSKEENDKLINYLLWIY